MLFPHLASIAKSVEEDGLKGGALLNMLYNKSTYGFPIVQACMERYDSRCLQPELRLSHTIAY